MGCGDHMEQGGHMERRRSASPCCFAAQSRYAGYTSSQRLYFIRASRLPAMTITSVQKYS